MTTTHNVSFLEVNLFYFANFFTIYIHLFTSLIHFHNCNKVRYRLLLQYVWSVWRRGWRRSALWKWTLDLERFTKTIGLRKASYHLHIVYFCIILRTLTSLVDEQKHNNGITVLLVTRVVALVTYLLFRKRASNIVLISRY